MSSSSSTSSSTSSWLPSTPYSPDTRLGTGSSSSTLGWVDPPAGLELTQAHWIVRHGERTPVRARLQNANPPIPQQWNLCKAGRSFSAAVLELAPQENHLDGSPFVADINVDSPAGSFMAGSKHMQVRRQVEGINAKEAPRIGKPDECMLGELTDVGRLSTLRIGRALRALYVDKVGLLPTTITPGTSSSVYFRSTNMPRTVESLQQLVRGLLPPSAQAAGYVPTVLVRDGTTENLLPNTFGCARLRALDRAFADAAAKVWNPRLAELDQKLAPQCEGQPVRVDGHPRANGILDTVRAAQAHNIPVAKVFEEPSTVALLEAAVVSEWFSGYSHPDATRRGEFRRLAMGRLLEDLNGSMQSKADKADKDPLRLALYSAHDTTLAGMLSTLDVFDGRWPAFAATMSFELFKDTRSKPSILSYIGLASAQPKHYVRIRYGDKPLRLPACAPEGKHFDGEPGLCTLDAFRDVVHSLRHPQGMSWEKECETGRGEKSSK